MENIENKFDIVFERKWNEKEGTRTDTVTDMNEGIYSQEYDNLRSAFIEYAEKVVTEEQDLKSKFLSSQRRHVELSIKVSYE